MIEKIRKANALDTDEITTLVQNTINKIYPHYYPYGAVNLFLTYQTTENICNDIKKDIVYVLEVDEEMIGTGTIKDNRICRLIVKTTKQGKGYGTMLMEFLENLIYKDYLNIQLEASLPACELYRKRGYETVEYKKLETKNGDYICYSVMQLQKNK